MKLENSMEYYDIAGVEAIVVIEALDMNFSEGNAFKYLYRCNNILPKGKTIDDLRKVKYYLTRLLNNPQIARSIWGNRYKARINSGVYDAEIYQAMGHILDAVGSKKHNYILCIEAALVCVNYEIGRY